MQGHAAQRARGTLAENMALALAIPLSLVTATTVKPTRVDSTLHTQSPAGNACTSRCRQHCVCFIAFARVLPGCQHITVPYNSQTRSCAHSMFPQPIRLAAHSITRHNSLTSRVIVLVCWSSCMRALLISADVQ